MKRKNQSPRSKQSQPQGKFIEDIEFEEVKNDSSDSDSHETIDAVSEALDMAMVRKKSSKQKSSIEVVTISIKIEYR